MTKEERIKRIKSRMESQMESQMEAEMSELNPAERQGFLLIRLAKLERERERCLDAAVKELREHGGTDQDVAALLEHFRQATKAEEERVEVRVVPD